MRLTNRAGARVAHGVAGVGGPDPWAGDDHAIAPTMSIDAPIDDAMRFIITISFHPSERDRARSTVKER
jgi:hypothetical protein